MPTILDLADAYLLDSHGTTRVDLPTFVMVSPQATKAALHPRPAPLTVKPQTTKVELDG